MMSKANFHNIDVKIVKLCELDIDERKDAIAVFVDCFYPTFKRISKDKEILQELFLSAFNMNLTYTAILDDKIVSFLAICNGKERSLKFKKDKCVELFGRVFGAIVHYELTFMLSKPNLKNENDVGIDFLATLASHRGKGIAGSLIEYTCSELCYDECYIDVAETNTTARRLYEFSGFKEYSKDRSIFNYMSGLGTAIRMKKTIKKV